MPEFQLDAQLLAWMMHNQAAPLTAMRYGRGGSD